MDDNTEDTEGKEVFRIQKNAGENIVFSLQVYRKFLICDLRVWTGGGRRTHKGLAFKRDLLPKFLEGVQTLIEASKRAERKAGFDAMMRTRPGAP